MVALQGALDTIGNSLTGRLKILTVFGIARNMRQRPRISNVVCRFG
jgi:hypothetical protein